jgi:hypothetical protein
MEPVGQLSDAIRRKYNGTEKGTAKAVLAPDIPRDPNENKYKWAL